MDKNTFKPVFVLFLSDHLCGRVLETLSPIAFTFELEFLWGDATNIVVINPFIVPLDVKAVTEFFACTSFGIH